MAKDQKYIDHLSQHIGETVLLRGWVSNKREGKGIAFIILRDGTGYCQCVVTEESTGAEYLKIAQSTSLETSVEIHGLVKQDEKQIGGIEIDVSEIKVVVTALIILFQKKSTVLNS